VRLTLADQYLRETYVDAAGQVVRRELSAARLRGPVEREVKLPAKWIYVAEPRESRERPLSFWEKTRQQAARTFGRILKGEEPHQPADVLFLFDAQATGGAYNDQAASSRRSRAQRSRDAAGADAQGGDRHRRPQPRDRPLHVTEALTQDQVDSLKSFLAEGGNLITDFRTDLATALGVRSSTRRW